jgi:hypothetical protein
MEKESQNFNQITKFLRTPSAKTSEMLNYLKNTTLKYFIINVIWIPAVLINVALIALNTFYRGWNYLEVWSFKLDDPTWLPGNLQNIPLYFGHYFGDYALTVGYAKVENIYNSNELIPFGAPPTSIPILEFFTLFPDRLGILLFILINLVLIIAICMNAKGSKGVILLLIILTSMPLFAALDRGNFIGISVFSIGLALILLDRRGIIPQIAIVILLIIAISLKIYVIGMLAFLVLIKKIRIVFFTVIIFILLNASWLLLTRYTLNEVMVSARISSEFQFTQYGINSLQGGVGPIATVYNLLVKFKGQFMADAFMTEFFSLNFIPALLYALLMVGILTSRQIDLIEKKSLILSGFMFFPPIAMNYTLLWTIPALIILLSENLKKKVNDVRNVTLILIAACIVTLVPWGFASYRLIYPILWVGILFGLNSYSLVQHYKEFRYKRTHI